MADKSSYEVLQLVVVNLTHCTAAYALDVIAGICGWDVIADHANSRRTNPEIPGKHFAGRLYITDEIEGDMICGSGE